jgi:glycosyltransferase involved in cell wall biosynthesis
MKIAMVGTRGIPARYSGFETAVEKLSEQFTAAGHEVVVYCRPHMTERRTRHAGARLVHLPTIRNKYLDTLVHTALSMLHVAVKERPDVVICFISGSAPVVPIARLAGIPVIFQIDGLDSDRAKWPRLAKAYLRWCERMAPRVATIAITDSEAVADEYERRYGRRLLAIPYGAELPDPGGTAWCERLGVEPGKFILFVGRLVPENNAHLLVEAYGMLDTDWPLVVVGDAPYAGDYIAKLKASAGPDVRFPGYVFGEGYAELVHRCGIMCVPTEVGGTHPVIVEAMAAGACLLVSDHAPNLEVVADSAASFPVHDGKDRLSTAIASLIRDPVLRTQLGSSAEGRARRLYSWTGCAAQYLSLLAAIVRREALAGGKN